jgi:pimeloyl-ACP methyl ester carboxylesterase
MSRARIILAGSAAALAAWNVYRARKAEHRHPPAGRFLTVGGVRLHYLERGEGPPTVMLHGNGVTSDDFELSRVLGLAAQSHRVIAFDRPGFGYSRRPRGVMWTAARQARLLRQALAAIALEPAVVIGHSWGTLVALALALDYPEAVRSLILLSGYYYPTVRADVALFSPPAIPIIGDIMRYTVSPPMAAAMLPALVKRSFAPLPVPDRFAKGFPAGLALRPSQIRAEAEDTAMMISAAAAMHDRYRELRMPVTIMAGTEDRIVDHRRHAIRLSKEVAHSTLRLVPSAGHMIHYAVPDQVVEAIGGRTAPVHSGAISQPCFVSADQHPCDIIRHDPTGRTLDPLSKETGAVRGFEVELDRVGAGGGPGLFDKARRRWRSTIPAPRIALQT